LTARARWSCAAAPPCRAPSPSHLSRSHRPRCHPLRTRYLLVQRAHEIGPPNLVPQCTAAVRRRSPPAERMRASTAVGSQSNASDLTRAADWVSSRHRPLDLDPTGWIRSKPSQTGMASPFCRKPPELFIFHKNTLPQ
jgi:hypothetical protein